MEPAYSDGGLLQRLCVRGKCKGIYQFAPKSLLFAELIDLIFPTLACHFLLSAWRCQARARTVLDRNTASQHQLKIMYFKLLL